MTNDQKTQSRETHPEMTEVESEDWDLKMLPYVYSTYSRMQRGKMNMTMKGMEDIQKNQRGHPQMKIITIKI